MACFSRKARKCFFVFIVVAILLTSYCTAKRAASKAHKAATKVRDSVTGARKTALEVHKTPPNVVLFIVDDLGWNQVGYHASKVGNHEIKTKHIDEHCKRGIELDRGYMTPWCGPSRAAIQAGRANVFNANVSNSPINFDDDIGFVAGMPPGTQTIASALKKYGYDIGVPYKAYYNGKWGIGGSSWLNSPMGVGYDETRGFWGDSIESCDGVITQLTSPLFGVLPGAGTDFGGVLGHVLPGYFDQGAHLNDTNWCPYVQGMDNATFTDEEKFISCKTRPRKLPKLMDEDLLDNVVRQIHEHDYETGPMLNVFATQLTHTPMQYPDRFDEKDESLPEYFKKNSTKPQPSAYDQRIGTAKLIEFVDELFGKTMEALRNAGQWDNTIVFFTSDNGGAIYSGTVNNNYPMRGSKFTAFEGGIRVPQFLTGGWIEKQVVKNYPAVSDTFIFATDVAPTLMQMVGADKEYLHGNRTGAVYGNGLWEQIKHSISSRDKSSHQLPRNVSYSFDLYFEVMADKTEKNMYVGLQPQLMPRHWNPIWPRNDDLLMDFGYTSVMPCRPGGEALSCCKMDMTNDPREFFPMNTTCEDLRRTAQILFEIEGGCELDADGNYVNNLCLQAGNRTLNQHPPEEFSLWSVARGQVPFVNSKGAAIRAEETLCYCDAAEGNVTAANADYFVPSNFYPTKCYNFESILNPAQAVPCNVTTRDDNRPPATFADHLKEGLDKNALEEIVLLEGQQLILLRRETLIFNMYTYATRRGFTRWPNVGKLPLITPAIDTCAEKNVTVVPLPVTSIVPYFYGASNPSIPFNENAGLKIGNTTLRLGLCQGYTTFLSFCPAKDNSNMSAIVSWHYSEDPSETYGMLADGRKITPLNAVECDSKCQLSPDGTAYIGGPETLPLGMEFSKNLGTIPIELAMSINNVDIVDVVQAGLGIGPAQARYVVSLLTPTARERLLAQFQTVIQRLDPGN